LKGNGSFCREVNQEGYNGGRCESAGKSRHGVGGESPLQGKE